VEFAFSARVAVRRTARTVAGGIARLTGHVAGKSRESDEADVLCYAVFLDERERVYMIEPDELEPA
jgi:hypothetical protein